MTLFDKIVLIAVKLLQQRHRGTWKWWHHYVYIVMKESRNFDQFSGTFKHGDIKHIATRCITLSKWKVGDKCSY